jgi:integrase
MASIYKRGRFYWIKYYVGSRCIRESLGTADFRKAERLKAKKELDIEKGEVDLTHKITIDGFLSQYAEYFLADHSKRTWRKSYGPSLRRFFKFVKKHCGTLRKINSGIGEDYKAARIRAGAGRGTINKDLAIGAAALNYAVKKGYIKENPLTANKVKRLKLPEYDFQYLTELEIGRLLRGIEGHRLEPMIQTALFAGLRASEIRWLEWLDIDFEKNLIHISNKDAHYTKSRKQRSVPIHESLRRTLENIPRTPQWVFPNTAGRIAKNNLEKSIRALSRRVGIDFTLQVLRRTFGTQLLTAGVPIKKVSQWLGHSSVAVTEKFYAKVITNGSDEDINKIPHFGKKHCAQKCAQDHGEGYQTLTKRTA